MSCLVILELENGKPNRPSLSTISAAKKLAKDIQEKNDNQDTPESILAFTTGDRIEKLDAYFDMYYLPTSRTGDKFVAATQYVKMKDKQGRDLKDKLGRQKYKKDWSKY